MLLAGIVGYEGRAKTASLISSFLISKGKKVSLADSAVLNGYQVKKLKSYILELEKNNTDILLFKLDEKDVEKLAENGLLFDVVIYTGTSDSEDSAVMDGEPFHPEKLEKLMNEKGISIINADDRELAPLLGGGKQQVVTYGFNSRASITTSSIGDPSIDGSFMCCLQKTIPTKNGDFIEPQEYKLKLEHGEYDTHHILAAASFAIVNGIDLNN